MSFKAIVNIPNTHTHTPERTHTHTQTPNPTLLNLSTSVITPHPFLAPSPSPSSLIQLYHDSAAQPLQHDSTFLSAPQPPSICWRVQEKQKWLKITGGRTIVLSHLHTNITVLSLSYIQALILQTCSMTTNSCIHTNITDSTLHTECYFKLHRHFNLS